MPSSLLFQKNSRRRFLFASSLATTALAFPASSFSALAQPVGSNRKVRIGVMGTNSRGLDHIKGFLSIPDVEIAAICDVDSRALDKASAAVAKLQAAKPASFADIRKMVEMKDLDAISIAAPNHWHAPATILACKAGKHVYVEKPCCHTAREGEVMVMAARKYGRKVQMGNQRRSWPWIQEAMINLHSNVIGKVTFARCWYNSQRPSIGRGKPAEVPSWLNYDLWQGTVEARPFRDNLVHYNWHWFWHWGDGELDNNGIHGLDLARWGLQVECPTRVSCGGGRYHFDDDQETPDIYVTTFDFPGKGATWESHSHHGHGMEGSSFGVLFYGDKGSLAILGNSAKIYDPQDKLIEEIKGKWNDTAHFGNFVESIRSGVPLNSEIEEGVKSTLWCHLGNIAYRSGKTLHMDDKKTRIKNDAEAEKLWKNVYRKEWAGLESA